MIAYSPSTGSLAEMMRNSNSLSPRGASATGGGGAGGGGGSIESARDERWLSAEEDLPRAAVALALGVSVTW